MSIDRGMDKEDMIYTYMYRLEYIETRIFTLAWKIPWIEEPGGLQPMGSLRVRHD